VSWQTELSLHTKTNCLPVLFLKQQLNFSYKVSYNFLSILTQGLWRIVSEWAPNPSHRYTFLFVWCFAFNTCWWLVDKPKLVNWRLVNCVMWLQHNGNDLLKERECLGRTRFSSPSHAEWRIDLRTNSLLLGLEKTTSTNIFQSWLLAFCTMQEVVNFNVVCS
jgi:hypothetical protein